MSTAVLLFINSSSFYINIKAFTSAEHELFRGINTEHGHLSMLFNPDKLEYNTVLTAIHQLQAQKGFLCENLL